MTTAAATPTSTDFPGLAVNGKLAQNAEPSKPGLLTDKAPGGYVLEPKMDGWRLLAFRGAYAVELYSRSGHSYTGKLPLVEAEILANFPPGSWIDGEAAAITDAHGGAVIDKWSTVQSVLTTYGTHSAHQAVSYVVFDLLAHGGIDARSLPFVKRRALLERIFDGGEFDRVKLVSQDEATLANHERNLERGYEGSVVKALGAKYASDHRGYGWTKVKPTKTIEGVVMGFKPGTNGFAGMVGAVIFGQHDPETGELVERGRVSGMTMKQRKSMTNYPAEWLGSVIEIAHEGVSIGESESGRFRFPRFKRVRADKTPDQVVFHDE